MPEDLKVITKTNDLILWCLPQIIKFPKAHRFTVGERMENILFDILEGLLEARYSKGKKDILRKVNLKLEKFRYLVRICVSLRFISLKKYEYLSREINEIGKLTGGWARQQAETAKAVQGRGQVEQ